MMLAFAAMMGWCGTKWPGWWRGGPRPGPWPEPWWIPVLGAIGGIGAWVVFGPELGRGGGLLAVTTIAFFGGMFLGSLGDTLGGFANRGNISAGNINAGPNG